MSDQKNESIDQKEADDKNEKQNLDVKQESVKSKPAEPEEKKEEEKEGKGAKEPKKEAAAQKEEAVAEVPEEEKIKDQDLSEDKEKEKSASAVISGDLNFFPPVREDLPKIKPGDVIQVSYRVIEGGKERTQVFEGTVIAIKNAGVAKTITVRKTSFGIAVERIFPLNSGLVQKIVINKHSKVRRAKLYYLRKLKGKAARLKELR